MDKHNSRLNVAYFIISVSQRKNFANKHRPTERPGLRRTTEMLTLYGTGAAMIHGMETALQLTYDRYRDAKKSMLWPQLPLNITF